MVTKSIVSAKLTELSMRIARVRAKCPTDALAFAQDGDAMELVSFNLMLAVQLCADVAAHIVSDERWAPASSLAECFLRLQEHSVLAESTAQSLRRAVGLRNVIAHGYGRVDPTLVFEAATSGLNDLSDFARQIAGWLQMQP